MGVHHTRWARHEEGYRLHVPVYRRQEKMAVEAGRGVLRQFSGTSAFASLRRHGVRPDPMDRSVEAPGRRSEGWRNHQELSYSPACFMGVTPAIVTLSKSDRLSVALHRRAR